MLLKFIQMFLHQICIYELIVSYYDTNFKIPESITQQIAINTLDEGDGDFSSQGLHKEQRKCITLSSVAEIAKHKKITKVNSTVTQLLYSKFRGNQGTG